MSMERNESTTLIIFFESSPALSICTDRPSKEIVTTTRTYTPLGTDWDGFYDWLRKDSKIIGLRQNSHTSELSFMHLPLVPYVVRGAFEDIEIYFSELRGYNADESDDQSFAYNQFWLSKDGHLAFAVDISTLSDTERSQLEGISAAGGTVQL
jgi:hypothetical protein